VRATSASQVVPGSLRRALERLDALPMRPGSVRHVLSTFLEIDPSAPLEPSPLPLSTTTDPAWALQLARSVRKPIDPLAAIADHRWWPVTASTGPVAEALTRLWRHSTAVAFAARRLARDANDPDPESVARAGLLHALGLWALAAVAPETLVAWYEAPDSSSRRDLERGWLVVDSRSLGRDLATRWGLEPLVVDSAWLHADLDADLNQCSSQPERLAMIQQAYAMASMTPWAPGAEVARDSGPIDPRVRILTAEVQARCGGPFVEVDSSAREERLTQDNARLRLIQARLVAESASKDRFLQALTESSPTDGPEAWADRAGLAWCGEPGVAAARVLWAGPDSGIQKDLSHSRSKISDLKSFQNKDLQSEIRDLKSADLIPESAIDPGAPRPPSTILPLGEPARPSALVHLWGIAGAAEVPERPSIASAWDAWARESAERFQLRRLLDEVVSSHRGRVAREEPTRRRLMLDALAEFAAGAGHELNNPLAVIVGRGQLLLAGETNPDSIRSLRAIIAQAQRAARILRDLMYVARPPEPRPRACQPEEVVRACLRDLQDEAEVRGVRLVADTREPGLRVWADPEPLRQLADVLTRNALEASSSGGLVQFTASGDARTIRWTVHDNGRGIGSTEGLHLFDPFYCGRQAGRGLGLGLPRAARIVAQAGGELKWQSNPGQGTTFLVTLPVSEIPASPDEERPGGPKPNRV
jgi:signal transduction histidine kinase